MPTSETSAADSARHVAALLAWYRNMGADAAVGHEAIDWLARGEVRPGATFEMPDFGAAKPVAPPRARAPAPATPSAPPARPRVDVQMVPTSAPPSRQFPTSGPDEATLAAREAAKAANTIEELQARLASFDGCGLKATAKSLCFYRGAGTARIMVIGEAPGAEDDKVGKPFVGPAGQMLDKMLAAIGLGEAEVHITNIVYWRPPGNRTPTPQEVLICKPFLERQVELVKPEFLILLGGPSAQIILAEAEGIMKLRGKWHDVTIGAHAARAIATLHPTQLIRTPLAKRMAWRDMLAIDAALKGIGKK